MSKTNEQLQQENRQLKTALIACIPLLDKAESKGYSGLLDLAMSLRDGHSIEVYRK